MAHYLVEAYTSKRSREDLGSLVARALRASAGMRRDGIDVRYVLPIFVPEDEICFHLFEAPSVEAVSEASRRAELVYERIVETAE